MISVKIRDANVAMGPPNNWRPSDGELDMLYLRKEKRGSLPVMLSAWKPSAAELELLMRGGSLVLGVLGEVHPPVLMYVSTED